MAHATVTIPSPPGKSAATKNASATRSQNAPSRTGASFAALMAKEQLTAAKADGPVAAANNQASASPTQEIKAERKAGANAAAASTQKKPVVAKLPDATTVFQNMALAGRSPSDILRTPGMASPRSMADYARDMVAGASTLEVSRNLGKPLNTIAAANNGKGFALTANDFIHTPGMLAARRANAARTKKAAQTTPDGIGKLSAKFESGGAGISAIGYDRTGGTSYGKYQIASKVGGMKNFLNFLDSEAPDLSKRLRAAGPANTGSRAGKMPDEWRAIAQDHPERFERLQEAYIMETHYKPALSAIEDATGVDSNSLSMAMREVIWSTAVQHGPTGAAKIFTRADEMSGKPSEAAYERNLINNVYTVRAGQFGSSSSKVRSAVLSRFREERQLALNLLEGGERASLA